MSPPDDGRRDKPRDDKPRDDKPRDDKPLRDGAVFRALDPELPVCLLPVRLATRFVRRGAQPPHTLRIRIFPDPISIDGHHDQLTEFELALGHAYWNECFAAGGRNPAAADARRWLVDQLGLPRARWVARATRPANIELIAKRPTPTFAKQPLRTAAAPLHAALLPAQWVAHTRVNNERAEAHFSTPVDRSAALVAAPQLTEMPDGGGIREFLDAQGLRWRHDFDAALEVGMAIEVPVTGEARIAGFSEVLVVGVTPEDRSGALGELLDHHRYHHGLDLLAQGAVTNHTDSTHVARRDPAAPEFWDPAASATGRAADTVGDSKRATPGLDKPAALYTAPNAVGATIALGLDSTAPFATAAGAGGRDSGDAEVLNRVLWPGLSARLFDQLLAVDPPLLAGADRQWLRQWFIAFVRGSALLPTIGVGDVPYGLLPTMALPSHIEPPVAGDRRSMLASKVVDWGLAWTGSTQMVPSVSPIDNGVELGATPPDEAVDIAAILGAVPHPTAFRLRSAPSQRSQITAAWNDADATLTALFAALPAPDNVWFDRYLPEHRDRVADAWSATSQRSSLSTLAFWVNNNAGVYNHLQPNPARLIVDHVEQVMYPLLEAHESRSRMTTILPELGGAVLPDADDPELWYVNYAGADPEAPTLSLLGTTAVEHFLEQLDRRVAAAQATARGKPTAPPTDERRSLLMVLIDQSIELVSKAAAGDLAAALGELRRIATAGTDTLAAIERLTAEALGVFTHRQDAWQTSLAAQRLAAIRAKHPTGVQVGCYGWLLGVRPDDGSPDTQGFVHAPSLDHAATAAMLRSAWRGLGGGASDAAFAVDVSSDRVRRASWLLDGIRNGHELGELLGQRLERRLHDAALDAHIADVRTAVLADAGRADEPASAIVDGLAVATAYQESNHGSPLHTAIEALRAAAPKRQRQPLLEVLRSSEADLDAVADVLTAQGVLAVVQGNASDAAATLATIGSNPGGVARPTVADVVAAAFTVSHRVSAILPSTAPPPGAALGITANPALDRWLAEMLPPFGDLRVGVRGPAGGKPTATATLGELGITATHLAAWCPAHVPLHESRLAQFVGAVFGADELAVLELDEVADAAVIAGALAEAVGLARPLTPADLLDPAVAGGGTTASTPAWDLGELAGRADAVAGALRARADRLQSATPRGAVADAALVDFGATLELLRQLGAGDDGGDDEDGDEDGEGAAATARLAAQLRARAAALDAAGRTDADTLTTAIRATGATPFAVVATMTVADPAPGVGWPAALADGARRLGDPARLRTWLLATGRVHRGVDALHQAILLSESLSVGPCVHPALLQLPLLPAVKDGWAALERPDPAAARARLCLVSVTDPTPAIAHGRLGGLLFDAWSESIPGDHLTTGVAVNFDSPTARAPQAVLLAVAPPGAGWTGPLLIETLHQTVQAARNRAVGPGTLRYHGHLLPAVFVDGKAEILTTAEVDETKGT